jgi:hypothetical protein
MTYLEDLGKQDLKLRKGDVLLRIKRGDGS